MQYHAALEEGGEAFVDLDGVNDSLMGEEGLPPFATYVEMVQAIKAQLAQGADMRTVAAALRNEGANSVKDLSKGQGRGRSGE